MLLIVKLSETFLPFTKHSLVLHFRQITLVCPDEQNQYIPFF